MYNNSDDEPHPTPYTVWDFSPHQDRPFADGNAVVLKFGMKPTRFCLNYLRRKRGLKRCVIILYS